MYAFEERPFFFSSYLESKVNEVDLRVPGETILMIQYI